MTAVGVVITAMEEGERTRILYSINRLLCKRDLQRVFNGGGEPIGEPAVKRRGGKKKKRGMEGTRQREGEGDVSVSETQPPSSPLDKFFPPSG